MSQRSPNILTRIWGKWKFHIALAFLSLALATALSELVLFGLTRAGLTDAFSYTLTIDYDKYVDSISDARREEFREKAYDPVLGWDLRPDVTRESKNSADQLIRESTDERGARSNPYVGEAKETGLTVLTFGESYTFGAEVNDNETWAYKLSGLLGTEIINFGVSAYGPDQALLKMERKIAEYDPDIVILGIMSENINRLMSMYRPFYSKDTGVYLGFKPMLNSLPDGEVRFLPNPLHQLNSKDDVLNAYQTAKEYDYWYTTDKRPVWSFPFTISMLQLINYRLFYGDLQIDTFSRMRQMYDTPEATEKMDFVIRSVFRLAEDNDFIAAVVFIPNGPDVKSFIEKGTYSYADYLRQVRETDWGQEGQIIDILEHVESLDHPFESESYNVNPYAAHPSPYGTSVIAEIIYRYLNVSGRASSSE